MATPYIIRHSLPTRLLHWVNAVCVIVVLMSGLNIFNADPSFYWGEHGAYPDKALWTVAGGRGIPGWATLPSWRDLATGRLLHFFFAWVLVVSSLVYLSISLIGGHVRRDLMPSRSEVAPRHILHDLRNHLRLRFPTGDAARRYNVLQKLAYLSVIFLLGPLILATGLTMSPGFDAACPWLLTLFGGRQSARTLHFAAAMLVVSFIVVHLAMVVLAGPINEIRSMITGRYVLPAAKPGRGDQ